MAQIKTEKQYMAACERINELLKIVSNDTPADDKNMLELDLISDLVADYEEEHYPIAAPTLVETIKLRMYEMGLTQTKLAEIRQFGIRFRTVRVVSCPQCNTPE